jgi:alkylhydroperoxidase/carboxymuconolactone decarboxylase family protein YurZ
MTDTNEDFDAEAFLAELLAKRGHLLPVHQLMAEVDAGVLKKYTDLSGDLLFGEEQKALDLKTRYLVLVGITTAVRGDPEGIVWSAKRAIQLGASRKEVLEAILLVALPGGVPPVEEATHVLHRIFDDWPRPTEH